MVAVDIPAAAVVGITAAVMVDTEAVAEAVDLVAAVVMEVQN